jgi:CRP/FNR family transcriptional regulator, cyclic AMP receptor protein
MSVRGIGQLLAEHPFFAGLDEDALTLLAGCAENVHFRAGEVLFRSGTPADRFFIVRSGRIALELVAPGRAPLVVETADAGEVVGWSWLVPPYQWFCDGRAVEETGVVALDGACLRAKCETDPSLGFQLLSRVTDVMYDRLQATRVRLLDLYGTPRAVGD